MTFPQVVCAPPADNPPPFESHFAHNAHYAKHFAPLYLALARILSDAHGKPVFWDDTRPLPAPFPHLPDADLKSASLSIDLAAGTISIPAQKKDHLAVVFEDHRDHALIYGRLVAGGPEPVMVTNAAV